MKTFNNPLDPENIQIKKAIRQWVLDRLKLDVSATIEIIENTCTEPNCVFAETLIAVSNTEGGDVFYKMSKPLVFIRKIDVALMQKMSTKPLFHKH